jgi:transcriptional regulator with XRE-family HTH domain
VDSAPEIGSARRGFGQRVRTARAYAGLSQGQLASSLAVAFPEVSVSAATIRRLENDDLGVKGSVYDWASRVAAITDTPEWFLVGGWTGAALVLEEAVPDIEVAMNDLRRARSMTEADLERTRVEAAALHDRHNEALERLAYLSEREGALRHSQVELNARLERLLATYRPKPKRVELAAQRLASGEDLETGEMEELIDAVLRNPEARRELGKKVPIIGFYRDEERATQSRASDPPTAVHPGLLTMALDGQVAWEILADAENERHAIEMLELWVDPDWERRRKDDATAIGQEFELDEPPVRNTSFPAEKLDRELLQRYLGGERLSTDEVAEVQAILRDPAIQSFLRSLVEELVDDKTAQSDATPRRASDAPLPEPPGELGRRSRASPHNRRS